MRKKMSSEELKMTSLQKMGEVFFRARDYSPIPVGVIALLFANPSVESLVLGGLVSLGGELARIYGVAFIGTISRTRSYSNGQLVTSGPFSVLRNPLYFGNLLLSLGFAIMSGVWWIPLMVVVFFYGQYIPIVAWEEMKLRRIFGQDYTKYCASVPNRWFPKLRAFVQYDWCVKPESWQPALRSEKRTLTAIAFVLALMLTLFFWNASTGNQVLPLANFLPFGK
jgi:protein-S-isoprenylcysteine O-methyltransferase Ste14